MPLAQWRDSMVGQKLAGTVTDDVTGDTGTYSWVCDSVRPETGSERLCFVLNDGHRAYREYCKGPDDLASMTVAALVAEIGAVLAGDVAQVLAAGRFADLVGEVL